MQATNVIYQLLLTPQITALVPASRITPYKQYQLNQLPAIVFEQVSLAPTQDKDGASKLDKVRIQVNIISTSYSNLQDICSAVRLRLERNSGTFGNVICQSITFEGETALYNNEPELEGVYVTAQDYILRIQR